MASATGSEGEQRETRLKILPNSLSSRLLAITAVWTILALLVTGLTLSTLFRQNAQRNFDNLLLAHVYNLMGAIDVDGRGELQGTPNLGDPRFLTPLSGWYWAVSRAAEPGTPLLHSASISGEPLSVPTVQSAPFSEAFRRTYRVPGPNSQEVQRLEAQLFVGEEDTLFQVMVGVSRDSLEESIADFNRSLLFFFSLFGLGTIIATFFVIRLGLRPLDRAAQALGDVREGRDDRITGAYPKEITPLVDEINGLIDANRSVVERARTQVGNLAHALKTPLAVIGNEIRGNGELSSEIVSEQTDAMQNQIETYLNRARIAAQVGTIAARTEVTPVIERLVRVMKKLSPHLNFSTDINSDFLFAGEEQDLEEILGNLLENASNHAASEVRLSVSTGTINAGRREALALTVEDDGPGVSEEQRGEILKRGKRLDESVPGTGLGLSIVKDITEEYRGALSLDDSALGGLSVAVMLPRIVPKRQPDSALKR